MAVHTLGATTARLPLFARALPAGAALKVLVLLVMPMLGMLAGARVRLNVFLHENAVLSLFVLLGVFPGGEC